LGSRDSTTGWRAKTFSESIIECFEFNRGDHRSFQGVGFYAAEDKMFLTADPVNLYDQLEPRTSEYFLVESVRKVYAPTPDNFFCRDVQCSALPLWQAAPGTLTWSKTRPQDPRRRIKAWLDTNLTSAQITKDDDSTQATYACIWKNPPYPLKQEFRAGSSPVQGLYLVGQPNSTALLGHDQIPCRYSEHVPVSICSVDSTGCSGTALLWKMEAELREVCENHPTGSQLSLERRGDRSRSLGGMWLYETEYVINYTRDLTT